MPEQLPTSPPATLRVAVGLLLAEAAALVAVVVFLGYENVTASSQSAGSGIATTLFAALLAATFGLVGWALLRRRGWARGPAIVLHLLMLPIGYSMATNGLPWLGTAVLLVGVGGGAALLAPATRAALGAR